MERCLRGNWLTSRNTGAIPFSNCLSTESMGTSTCGPQLGHLQKRRATLGSGEKACGLSKQLSAKSYFDLYARVALDEGLLTLIGEEIRPEGLRLVCQEPESGKLYGVVRPGSWTDEEEAGYVAEMRRSLLGDSQVC